jgi:hypothetical protein
MECFATLEASWAVDLISCVKFCAALYIRSTGKRVSSAIAAIDFSCMIRITLERNCPALEIVASQACHRRLLFPQSLNAARVVSVLAPELSELI